MPSLKIEQVFMDKYTIKESLGRGGMGEAFLAIEKGSDRYCVIKRSRDSDPDGNYEQLVDEARIMEKISHDHEHLPTLYEYGTCKVEGEENATPYIVMEYIEGDLLERKIKMKEYDLEDVVQWGTDILETLCYIHAHQLIHRDIHPRNICITPNNRAVLLDFGISRHLDVAYTRTIIAGKLTPQYAPIEQFIPNNQGIHPAFVDADHYIRGVHENGYRTGRYTDIYGLAATLYCVVTGNPPMNPVERLILGKQPLKRNSKFNVPSVLFDILLKALKIDPSERYQTANDMLFAWSQIQPSLSDNQVIQDYELNLQWTSVEDSPRSSLIEPVSVAGQELVFILAGEFYMGNEELKQKPFPIRLPSYYMGRYPVTNADYKQFIDARPDWKVPPRISRRDELYGWDDVTRTYTPGFDNYPVVLISWMDSQEYLRWLTQKTGHHFRLPSEAEWEKAACWDASVGQSRRYPWGNAFDEKKCNISSASSNSSKLMPVDHYIPRGNSPYGLVDMSGNVWEWTNTIYRLYPYRVDANLERYSEEEDRIIRGGAYTSPAKSALCASRKYDGIARRKRDLGFRIACDFVD